MNARQTLLLAAAGAFAGGFFAGLVYTSERGQATRRRLAASAYDSAAWMEHRFHEVEAQLRALEAQIEQTGQAFAGRVREAADQAAEQYIPQAPKDWEIEGDEVSRALSLPRR